MIKEEMAFLSISLCILVASTVFTEVAGKQEPVSLDVGQFGKIKDVLGEVIQLEVFEKRLRLARNWQDDWKKRKNNREKTPREICTEFEGVLAEQGLLSPEALATRLLYFLYREQDELLTDMESEFCKEIEEQEKNRDQLMSKRGLRKRPPMLHLEHGESNPNFLALDAAILMLASKYRDQHGRGSGGSRMLRRTKFYGKKMCGECSRLQNGKQLRFTFFENQSPFRRLALSDHLDGNLVLRYSDSQLTIDLRQKPRGEIRMVLIEPGISKVVQAENFATLTHSNPRLINGRLSAALQAIGIFLPKVSAEGDTSAVE